MIGPFVARRGARIAVLLLLTLLGGCAGEPRIDFGSGADTIGDLDRQRAIMNGIDGTPPVGGNRVTVLRDGIQAFPAMFDAMRHARDSINLEYYTFDDVRSRGTSLGDVLVDRLRHGVAVNIIYDAYGSNLTPVAFLRRLASAGAAIIPFNPNPLSGGKLSSPNDRDHRKIMIVDGRIGFVGGINLDHVYENPPPAGVAPDDAARAYWRDTAARIEGPAVKVLQRVFFDTWKKQNGPAVGPRDWFPKLSSKGDQIVRVLASEPGEGRPLYYAWLLRAIHAARHGISLSTGYFIPTHQQREELGKAARRGVRVRLVLPSRGDVGDAIAAGRAAYGDLLESGAQIHEVQNMVLHAKFVVIDGVWMAIGSSNFDNRSALFNNEIDAVVLGSSAAQGEAVFDQDLSLSKQIDLEAWRHRPFIERLREWRARIWEFLL